jgi:hypothetical protein
MKIKDIALSAAYVGQSVVKAICVGAQEVWSAIKYIVFKDKVVAQICATKWGDGNGLTEEDAAKVTSLGNVFQNNKEITSFDELEKFGVTIIGASSFYGCANLESISLSPKVTEIGRQSFSGCSALAIYLDSGSITKVDQQAFEYSGLVSINLPNANSLVMLAFQNCKQLKRVESIGSSPVTGQLFYQCSSLEYVNLPQGITKIGGSAFDGCSSLKITPPTSLVTIEGAAFSGVPIEGELNLPNAITLNNMAFRSTRITKAYIPLVKTLGTATSGVAGVFMSCYNLASVVLSPDLETIGAGAFYGDENLVIEDLNCPKLKNMYGLSFFQTKIKKVSNLGEITKIAGQTFFGCKSLASVRIPSTVTSIEGESFNVCNSLAEVIVEAVAPPTLGSNVFNGTPSTMTIYVPDASVEAYKTASNWSTYTDRIEPLSKYVES